MTREEAIRRLKEGAPFSELYIRAWEEALEMAIKALETLEEFEKAQIITGGRLNGRTYAYKCGLEDEKRKALEQEPKWIPIKTRPLTEAEREELLTEDSDGIEFMYDCPLPEDGEEVLITTRYGEVRTDTFYRDEGCYFETYCDEDDVKAWMPKPKQYKESEDK